MIPFKRWVNFNKAQTAEKFDFLSSDFNKYLQQSNMTWNFVCISVSTEILQQGMFYWGRTTLPRFPIMVWPVVCMNS